MQILKLSESPVFHWNVSIVTYDTEQLILQDFGGRSTHSLAAVIAAWKSAKNIVWRPGTNSKSQILISSKFLLNITHSMIQRLPWRVFLRTYLQGNTGYF